MKDNTAALKEGMNGHTYFSDMNHPAEMGRKVINVVVASNGHSVLHSAATGGQVSFSPLRGFQKCYPYKADI